MNENGNGELLTCVAAWPCARGSGGRNGHGLRIRSTYRRHDHRRLRHHGRVLRRPRLHLLRHHQIWRICPWTAPLGPDVHTLSDRLIRVRRRRRPGRSQTPRMQSPVGCGRSRRCADFRTPRTRTPGRSCGHCCPGRRRTPSCRWGGATFCLFCFSQLGLGLGAAVLMWQQRPLQRRKNR